MAISWLKKGSESASLAKQHQADIEKRKAEAGSMWRFWLKEGEEASVTFVDGEISAQGFLCPPRYYEHSLYMNGSYNNHFVCPEKTNPESGEKCPICAGGDRPALVAVFTVIDHRKFKTKDDKEISNTRKLFVVKSSAFEMLNKAAVKRDGLTGCRFDISRVGDKSPNTGNVFDFVNKESPEVLRKKYEVQVKVEGGTKTDTLFKPADYEKEIVFRTAAQLAEMGFGSSNGYQAPKSISGSESKPANPENYDEVL